jgi:hypothetical protein
MKRAREFERALRLCRLALMRSVSFGSRCGMECAIACRSTFETKAPPKRRFFEVPRETGEVRSSGDHRGRPRRSKPRLYARGSPPGMRR